MLFQNDNAQQIVEKVKNQYPMTNAKLTLLTTKINGEIMKCRRKRERYG